MNFRFMESTAEISPDAWDACLGTGASPLLKHGWMSSFEDSGSMVPESGWQALHICGYEDDPRRPLYILPLYLKAHSWGEFVFDFAWADAARQLGREYYPKAVGLVPATPVTVYEPLHNAAGASAKELLSAAIDWATPRLRSMGINSLSFLFTTDEFADDLEVLGFHRWIHQGFAWKNRGYRDFEGYLDTFTKNQRKNIRKERRSAEPQGLHLEYLTGDAITESTAERMYRLYHQTNTQFGPYAAEFLNRDFFLLATERFRDNLVFFTAGETGASEPLALSMVAHGNDFMYGRYWGTAEYRKDLHFNLCYYEPIDFAIQRGVQIFDPGMGGEHKIRRGFEPVQQFSMHRYFDPAMDDLFRDNIHQFNRHALREIDAIRDILPQKL